jgi:hypothetical protein
MMLLCRLLLLAAALVPGACAGGTFIEYPLFPRQTCPTCWDDLHQGPDSPRPR